MASSKQLPSTLSGSHWKTEEYIREPFVGLLEKQVRTRGLSAEDLQEDLANSRLVVNRSTVQ